MTVLHKARNIYEQQSYNRRMTALVIFLFILFLAFLGFGFDLYFSGSPGGNGFIPIGTLVAIGIGSASAAWSLSGGASVVLKATNATPIDPSNPSHRQLVNVVEEMCIASGMPKPQVYVVPDTDPNAFATGTHPQNSAVAVTQGLLDSLNREELQAVIAHEISHIRNYDVRLMTIVAALAGAVLLLSDWSARMLRFGGSRRGKRDSKGMGHFGLVILVLWIGSVILAPLVSRMLALAVSRNREYFADASAAELTRNPRALAQALQKIESAEAPTVAIKRGAAHLCIIDPTGRKLNDKEGLLAELFGTHPPIKKRIIVLNAMAYQYQPAPGPTPSA
jgi:heat shock protein HtpX